VIFDPDSTENPEHDWDLELRAQLLAQARQVAPSVEEVAKVNPLYMSFEDPFMIHQLKKLWELSAAIFPLEAQREARIAAVAAQFALYVAEGLLKTIEAQREILQKRKRRVRPGSNG
jgi:hypothetical protein